MHGLKPDDFPSGWITARLYASKLGHPSSSALEGESQKVKALFWEIYWATCRQWDCCHKRREWRKIRQNSAWLKRKGERKKVNKRKLGSCGEWACYKRMHRQCCYDCPEQGEVLYRAGGLRRLWGEDRKGNCLLWDRQDPIYDVKAILGTKTGLGCWYFALGSFWSPAGHCWKGMADFFILFYYFCLHWENFCPVRWMTEYLCVCLALTQIIYSSWYWITLLWNCYGFVVSPLLGKYHFPNCISASGTITCQELQRMQPEAPRKARARVVFLFHAYFPRDWDQKIQVHVHLGSLSNSSPCCQGALLIQMTF